MSVANENILREYNIRVISEFGTSPVTIEHYSSFYDVYSDGKIWTHNGKRFLPHADNGKGYLGVNLYNSDKRTSRRMYVHRLVALCFIENTDNKSDVNHKDFDKSNNNVENLEWMSELENTRHAIAGGRLQIRLDNEVEVRNNWIGNIVGNRKILEVIDRQAKAGNFYVQVECLLCGNTNLTMCHNDFLKNRVKGCRECKRTRGISD